MVVGGVELFRVEPTAGEDASEDEEVPAEPEEEAKDWWADSFDAALGGSLTAFPAAPRATFRDGELVALTCEGSIPARDETKRTPELVVVELPEAARRLHEAVLNRGEGLIVSPPESMPEAITAMKTLGWQQPADPTLLVFGDRGGIDVIRLVKARRAVRGGKVCPTWVHRGDADMVAAAAPIALYDILVVTAESTACRTVNGEMCLGPFVAREHGLDRPGLALSSSTESDPLKAFAELRTLIEARDGLVKSSQRVVVVDGFGRTVMPPIEAGPSFEPADPHDPLDWAVAIEQRQPSDTPSEAHGDILLEWPWNPSDPSSAIKTLRFDSSEAARAHAMKHGLVGFRVLEPTAVAQVVDQAAPTVTTTSPTRTSLLVGGRPGVQHNADRDGMVALYGEKSWPVRVFDGEVPPAGDWRSISAEPFAPTPENMRKATEAMLAADWQQLRLATAPKGYTFERLKPGGAIIVRHEDSYVGSHLSDGRAMAGGRDLAAKDIARHTEAWDFARILQEMDGWQR